MYLEIHSKILQILLENIIMQAPNQQFQPTAGEGPHITEREASEVISHQILALIIFVEL